ncbi:hypothetical protein D1007_18024 [Hordeum vulgare]|nr:hypothetical protein D1007_18024 [Hordeum vulgare]
MATGGDGGLADDGRDDGDLSITHSVGRSTLHCSPTVLPGEPWDMRFHFHGCDNLERTLCESDITCIKMLAITGIEDYDQNDSMCYVKQEGVRMTVMQLIKSEKDVEETLLQDTAHGKILHGNLKGTILPLNLERDGWNGLWLLDLVDRIELQLPSCVMVGIKRE